MPLHERLIAIMTNGNSTGMYAEGKSAGGRELP
jgi:hypothetical protein